MNSRIRIAACIIIICCSACSDNQKAPRESAIDNIVLSSVSPAVNGDKVEIDIKRSSIIWRGTKLGGSRGHEGTLGITEGYLIFNNHSLAGGKVVADMNIIGVTDIPSHEREAIYNLTSHLKSDFDSKTYPFANFQITDVQYFDKDSLRISGQMTIKDVTQTISVPAKIKKSGGHPDIFTTQFNLNRFNWNIGIDGSWLEKRLVDEELVVEVELKVLIYSLDTKTY